MGKLALIWLALGWTMGGALADTLGPDAPLPPRRPVDLVPLVSSGTSGLEVCAALTGRGTFQAVKQAEIVATEGCGIPSPIRLSAIVLRNGGTVNVEPAALVQCAFATALADWVREDVAPLVQNDQPMVRLEIAGAYECRGRNRMTDTKLSEHATGNAIDISGIVSSDHQRFDIAHQGKAPALFAAMQASACKRFATVLGPGSDGFHETHLHLDLQVRANGSHYCHWVIQPASNGDMPNSAAPPKP